MEIRLTTRVVHLAANRTQRQTQIEKRERKREEKKVRQRNCADIRNIQENSTQVRSQTLNTHLWVSWHYRTPTPGSTMVLHCTPPSTTTTEERQNMQDRDRTPPSDSECCGKVSANNVCFLWFMIITSTRTHILKRKKIYPQKNTHTKKKKDFII